MSSSRWRTGRLRSVLLASALGAGLSGCCGFNDALLEVHVVDGETGYVLATPSISADGETLFCNDGSFGFLADRAPAPAALSDGGTVVPPPGALDMGLRPPPVTRWCQTYSVSLEAGFHTVKVSETGYFTSTVQVDMGSGGDSFSCPAPKDVETTIALYRRP